MRLGIALLALGWCAGSVPACAAPLLREALDAAVERNADAQGLRARRNEIAARAKAAGWLLPAPPAALLSARRDNTLIDDQLGKREFEAEIELPLWLPGQQRATRSRVTADATVLSESEQAVRYTVAGTLREQIANSIEARIAADIARQRLQTAIELEGIVARRYKGGDVGRGDLSQAQSEVFAARAAVVEAELSLRQALEEYRALTGLGDLPADMDEPSAAGADPFQAPLLRLARSRVEAARAQVDLVQRTSRDSPTLALQSRSDRDVYGADTRNTIRLTIRIPFSTEARNAPRLTGAQAEVTQAMADERQLRWRVEKDVAVSSAALDAANAKAELARSARQAAEDALRLARRGFEAGETPVTTLLLVRARAIEAAFADGRAQAGLLRAKSRYNQALGVIP